MTNWLNDLSEYLDRLETTAFELDAAVQTTRSLTRDGAYGALPEATLNLQSGLTELEQRLEQRRALLDHSDAPGKAYSLRGALELLLAQPEYQELARALLDRCQAISRQIDQIREDAITLFVCQFHLSDTTSHFLRLIMPQAELTETYSSQSRIHQGGGLLDRAG